MIINKLRMVTILLGLFVSLNTNAGAINTMTGTDILQQFNAVVIGNDVSQSHVDGRTWVGGNLTGGVYAQNASKAANSNYSGLTVMGNASNVTVNSLGTTVKGNLSNSNINSGQSYIAGNVSGSNLNGKSAIGGTKTNTNQNGGTFSDSTNQIANAITQASSTDFATVLKALSNGISTTTETGGSIISNGYGRVTFNLTPNSNGLAVFDLTGILNSIVFSATEYQFNLNGATSLIINSDVNSATIGSNFLGGQAQTLGTLALWNFYNATSLTINNQFGGSILAPVATLTNNQNIEGGVYVNTLYQNGEIHQNTINSSLVNNINALNMTAVPEPSSYLLILIGLLALFIIIKKNNNFNKVIN